MMINGSLQMDNSSQTTNNDIINKELQLALVSISAILLLIGLVGNTATIVIIRYKKNFHNVTFTAVALLAIVDLIALCFRSTVFAYNSAYFVSGIFLFSSKTHDWLQTANFLTFTCSCFHVIILARLRYKILAFPFEAVYLGTKQMVHQSIVAWYLSSVVGVFYGLNIFFNDLYHSSIVEIFSGVLLCLSTVLPIVGFHFLKIRKLREGVTERRDTIRAMNRMVFAICIVQLLSTTSSAMLTILFFETKINTAILVWTFTVVVLSNHAANPMLFFFFNLYKKHFNQRQTNCNNVAENTHTDSRL